MTILTNFLYQLLFTVGVIIAFGLIIAICRRIFCKLLGRPGYRFILTTGIIGTPIHELSHALMCIVFGHKITEIKLFQPFSDDGTLGYVNHSYNPKNIYHQIGNFFIGVAPIIVSSGFLFLFMYLLVPNTFSSVKNEISLFSENATSLLDSDSISNIFALFGGILGAIFDFSNLGNVLWWVFFVLAIMISSHMELSGADIKGSVLGLIVIALLLLIANVILGLISTNVLTSFTAFMASVGLTIASFLVISVVFSAVMLVVAIIIKLIGKILGR